MITLYNSFTNYIVVTIMFGRFLKRNIGVECTPGYEVPAGCMAPDEIKGYLDGANKDGTTEQLMANGRYGELVKAYEAKTGIPYKNS